MNYLLNKLKLAGVGVLAMSFFMAVTLSSCGSKSDNNSSESTESVQEEAQPAADEAMEMDSTMHEEEHPAGEEHPADSAGGGDEHPAE